MIKIGIICVSYKTDLQSENFVRQLLALSPRQDVDIYLVNNSAKSNVLDPLLELEQLSPKVKVLPSPENPGYFGAARKAYKLLADRGLTYDWVIVSNVDMQIESNDFLTSLERMTSKDCGVVAPCIFSTLSYKDTNPLMRVRPTKGKMLFYKYVFSNVFTSQLYNIAGLLKAKLKSKSSSLNPSSAEEIYAPQGSFMIFSKDFFARGGTFDHGVFLYGEEVTVAEKCRKLGLKIIHLPEMRLIHHERGSTGLLYSRQVLKWKNESNAYIFNEYFKNDK